MFGSSPESSTSLSTARRCRRQAANTCGDYYDCQVEKDGGLTVVIGDATGHGINAGMMVTAIRSLLTNLMREPVLAKIFERLNGALKRVNLQR